MTNITIDQDLKDILNKLDRQFDKIDQKLDNLQKDVTDLKIGQTKLDGEIKALDEKLSGQIKSVDEKLSGQIQKVDIKCDGLEKRISNQEFYNRGIFGGLILLILGSAIKFFGFFPNV